MTGEVNRLDCPKCGLSVTVDVNGHLERIHCEHCGWTESSTVYPGNEVSLIGESPQLVTVQIEWSGPAVMSGEIVRAREALPELRSIPLSELLKRAKQSKIYTLGTYSMPQAIDLQQYAKENGVTLSFTKVACE